MSLTETDIKAMRVPEREAWVNDGAGLYLRLLPSGRRSWVRRSKKNGKTSYETLGEWPTVTVKQARAALARRAGRGVSVNALTVEAALEEWFSDQIEREYRVTKNIRVYVNRAGAEFGKRRLQELTQTEIAKAARAYGREAPVAANRFLTTLKLAFGWCCEQGYLDRNPAADLTTRVAGGDEVSRGRTLSDGEIRALWQVESPNANLLRALLLTGCRISELQRAAHAHVFADIEDAEGKRHPGPWLLIPAAHSKNRRAHHVYLTDAAREQFNGSAPLLFRSVSPTAVQAWTRRLQLDPEERPRAAWLALRPMDRETREPVGNAWTPHDLRRTLSTRLNGSLKIAPHVVEKLLNHTAQGMAAIYNRAELFPERVEATRKWTAELVRIVTQRA